MCGSNVSDFHKNSLNMGKFSTQVPLNMSLPKFPELLGVNIANTQKLWQMDPIFQEKSLKPNLSMGGESFFTPNQKVLP